MPTNSASDEVLERAGAEQHAPTNRIAPTGQQRDDRGVDRAHQGLVDGEVGRLAVGHPAAAGDARGVLPDLVEHDDGVVERVAEDRQQADDRRRRDLEADERVDADRDDEVVHQRDDARRRAIFHSKAIDEVDRRRATRKTTRPVSAFFVISLAPARPDQLAADVVRARRRTPRRAPSVTSSTRSVVERLGLRPGSCRRRRCCTIGSRRRRRRPATASRGLPRTPSGDGDAELGTAA